jgi:NAD(P)-dependent dehydrogenase (short-subunit alcohol dehydrogenase family)
MRVHVCDVSQKALDDSRRREPGITGSLADVSNEDQVAAMFADIERDMGGLDALVNNAGIAGPTGGVNEISTADWRRTIDVNLNSAFYCTRLAVPLLRQSSAGSIINISSVAGRLGYAYRTPYAATKWAIIGFTQSLAKELGPEGIRANAILPGIVRGPRIDAVIEARAQALGIDHATMEERYLENVSLRRMVDSQDVAEMALFLCSPGARNITGQSLSVCGNVENL